MWHFLLSRCCVYVNLYTCATSIIIFLYRTVHHSISTYYIESWITCSNETTETQACQQEPCTPFSRPTTPATVTTTPHPCRRRMRRIPTLNASARGYDTVRAFPFVNEARDPGFVEPVFVQYIGESGAWLTDEECHLVPYGWSIRQDQNVSYHMAIVDSNATLRQIVRQLTLQVKLD